MAYKQGNVFKTDIEHINEIIEQIKQLNSNKPVLIELKNIKHTKNKL